MSRRDCDNLTWLVTKERRRYLLFKTRKRPGRIFLHRAGPHISTGPGRAGPGQGPGRAMGGDWIGWSRVSCQLVERSLAWLE